MHIRKDPSFFFTKSIGALRVLDEVLGQVFFNMPRAHSVIDCRLDQTVVELYLEDQWYNRTIGAQARCPHSSFQIRLGTPYIVLEYLLM
jgi:hypothetical protein